VKDEHIGPPSAARVRHLAPVSEPACDRREYRTVRPPVLVGFNALLPSEWCAGRGRKSLMRVKRPKTRPDEAHHKPAGFYDAGS